MPQRGHHGTTTVAVCGTVVALAAPARKGRKRPPVCKAANHPSHPESYASGHRMRRSASKMKEEYTPLPSNLLPSLTPFTHRTINQLHLPSNQPWGTMGALGRHWRRQQPSSMQQNTRTGQLAERRHGCSSSTKVAAKKTKQDDTLKRLAAVVARTPLSKLQPYRFRT